MLALTRKYQPMMADRLQGERVRFLKGHMQEQLVFKRGECINIRADILSLLLNSQYS